VFPLLASIGSYTGPVYGISGVTAVYLNGVAQPNGWSVSSGYLPQITFTSAPGVGVGIAADFGILWLCRFAEDVQDFEEFMTMLWALRTVRLVTVRARDGPAAVVPDAARPGLERPQKAVVFPGGREPRFWPRGSR